MGNNESSLERIDCRLHIPIKSSISSESNKNPFYNLTFWQVNRLGFCGNRKIYEVGVIVMNDKLLIFLPEFRECAAQMVLEVGP